MPKKVLLVDDSATTRLMCRSIIARNTNHAVICAQDGDQTLDLVSSEKPDLVLMDVMMRGMSRLELCQQLRTAEESVQEGFGSGCTAHL